ncbi:hypothetical protein ACFO0N_16610 [Halobium salinum]|uniref:Copper resistance protein D n=1 Tax=Halobium salinum TaxID=1364940 RepID=A0ABD5PFL6_9EURY|nr:hypothetical protein [Halobium salinum]
MSLHVGLLPALPPGLALAPLASPPPSALPLASPTVSLLVRWLHVVAATVALGGAVLLWGVLRDSSVVDLDFDTDSTLTLATAYEWLFWVALGALVMTGVGNLGTYAPAIPGGSWAAAMTWKLAAVFLVLVGSAVRTLLVVRWRDGGASAPDRRRVLRVGYAATALALAGVVALAEVLAHG